MSNDNEQEFTQAQAQADIAALRIAQHILEKYVRLSAVRVYDAIDEIDSVIDLITRHTPATPQTAANNLNTESENPV